MWTCGRIQRNGLSSFLYPPAQNIHMDLKNAESELGTLYKTREYILPVQRKAVMLCATAIRQVHVGNIAEAERIGGEALAEIKDLESKVEKFPRLRTFLGTPYQEYAELMVLLSMLENGEMPELDLPAEAYVLGSLDAIGELKRVCMELLAQGKKEDAIGLFGKMEGLYYSMQGYAFPNSLVPGFKHKQDVMKGVLENLHHTIAEARMR